MDKNSFSTLGLDRCFPAISAQQFSVKNEWHHLIEITGIK
jgi:hypothetical protein